MTTNRNLVRFIHSQDLCKCRTQYKKFSGAQIPIFGYKSRRDGPIYPSVEPEIPLFWPYIWCTSALSLPRICRTNIRNRDVCAENDVLEMTRYARTII